MGTLKKDHVLEAGTGAVAAGVTGAAIGAAVAGPVGLALGAAAGGALGAVVGERVGEARDTRGDLGHFEQIFRDMPYYVDGMSWDDYAPAYRHGLDTWHTHGALGFGAAEADLESAWAQARDASRLHWAQARGAVEHAWRELAHGAGTRDA